MNKCESPKTPDIEENEMGTIYLADDLATLTAKVAKNKRLDILLSARGTLIRLQTRSGSNYTIVVLDPVRREVVFFGGSMSELSEPDIFELRGSNSGGAATVEGQIVVGLRLSICRERDGEYFNTNWITTANIVIDPEAAAKIMQVAETKRRQPKTPEEQAQDEAALRSWIVETFGSEAPEVQELMEKYPNPRARQQILAILLQSKDEDKFSGASALIKQNFQEHWSHLPKDLRGVIRNPVDNAVYNDIYLNLGLSTKN